MSSKTRCVAAIALFALTACGGGSDHTSPTPNPNPVGSAITVSGRVQDGWKKPIAAIPVIVSGKGPVVTDGNGRFSVSDVTAPYDVSIINSGLISATIYKGLTRADPVLVSSAQSPITWSANWSGSISGVSLPQPASHYTTVVVMAPDGGRDDGTTSSAGAYAFPSFRWFGSPSTTGAIYALQVRTSATGVPLEYKAYGKREDVTLANGGTFAGQNVRLEPIGSGNVSGMISAPAGYTRDGSGLYLQLSPESTMALASEISSASTFSFVTPNIGPTALTIAAWARKATGPSSTSYRRGIPATATALALNIRAAPEQTSPADGAVGVTTSTQLSWSGFAGGVHVVRIYSPTPGKPSYDIYTKGTRTTIPDLSAVGMGLPRSTSYKWWINGYEPIDTVDQIAVEGGVYGLFKTLSGDSSQAYSGDKSFNTGP